MSLQWAKDHGAIIHPNISVQDTTHGPGLVTTKPIDLTELEEPLVCVPMKLVIDMETIFQYVVNRPDDKLAVLILDQLGEQSQRTVLVTFLFYQVYLSRQGREDPLWGPWIKTLPPSVKIHLPFVWDEEALASIEHTSIHKATLAKRASVEALFRQMIQPQLDLKDTAGSDSDSDDQTRYFDDWLLCQQWVSSRSLELADGSVAMVPVIDMCNHSGDQNAEYIQFSTGEDSQKAGAGAESGKAVSNVVSLVPDYQSLGPDRSVLDGEITINYGPDKQSGEFLFSYGFIPSDHVHAKKIVHFYDPADPATVDSFKPRSGPESLVKDWKSWYDTVHNEFARAVPPQLAVSIQTGSAGEKFFGWTDSRIVAYCCQKWLKPVDKEDMKVEAETGTGPKMMLRGNPIDIVAIQNGMLDQYSAKVSQLSRMLGTSVVLNVVRTLLQRYEALSTPGGGHVHRLHDLEKALLENCVTILEGEIKDDDILDTIGLPTYHEPIVALSKGLEAQKLG